MINKQVEVVEMSPAQAKHFIDNNLYRGQRTVRKWWVGYLNQQMKEGKFGDKTAIHVAHDSRYDYLIDGQHRLMALAMGDTANQRFVIVHHQLNGNKEEQLAELYSRIDQGLKRSFSDVSDAWNLLEATGLDNKTQLNQLAAGCKVLNGNWTDSRRLDLEILVSMVIEWSQYAKMFYESIREGELGSLILKSPVMAVALVTFKYQPELSYEFWHQVAYNDMIGRADPRARLHKFLWDARVISNNKGVRYSLFEFGLVCARCWNAFLDKQELTKLYIPNMPPEGYLIKKTGVYIGYNSSDSDL